MNYKIIYTDYAIYNLAIFIESIRKKHINRFSDTWLEDLLITDEFNYKLNEFYNEAVEFIKNKLNSWMIWEIQEKSEDFYLKKVVLHIKSYTLVLQCKQYLNEKTILIYDLKVN
jgi:hypothetical protein